MSEWREGIFRSRKQPIVIRNYNSFNDLCGVDHTYKLIDVNDDEFK